MSPMKTRSLSLNVLASSATAVLSLLFVVVSVGAQTVPPGSQSIVGQWRADAPLPNGVVQTFRFDPDGSFDLAKALSVEGTYRVDGNQLIETVTLPSVGATHTDTATFAIAGDSLVVNERGTATPRVLHRSAPQPATSSIVGDWTIQVGSEMAAHYVFDSGGTMHVRASVGDERGNYVIHADTLRLSNDQTFELPATAQFAIVDSVLTLTPPSGKQARHFHRVAPR
jgi:hypothetical protein